jgi:hypothetical protein
MVLILAEEILLADKRSVDDIEILASSSWEEAFSVHEVSNNKSGGGDIHEC